MKSKTLAPWPGPSAKPAPLSQRYGRGFAVGDRITRLEGGCIVVDFEEDAVVVARPSLAGRPIEMTFFGEAIGLLRPRGKSR